MIKFATLLRREVWEHPSIWRVPAIAVVLAVLSNVAFSDAIVKISFTPLVIASNVVGGSLRVVTILLFMVFSLMALFYLLDCLHAERKDKSILFWRSLPVSDTATVLSKFFTGVVIIPLCLLLTILAVQIVSAGAQWLVAGGESSTVVDAALESSMFDYWVEFANLLTKLMVWMLPLFAWFLFCSSWVSRTPLIVATGLPLIIALVLNIAKLDLNVFGLFVERWPFSFKVLVALGFTTLKGQSIPQFSFIDEKYFIDFSSAAEFYSHPAVWGGLVVTVLLLGAAVWIRRWRDDG